MLKKKIEFTCDKCFKWRRTFTLAVLSTLWNEPPYDAGPYCATCASNEYVRAVIPPELKGLLLVWSERVI